MNECMYLYTLHLHNEHKFVQSVQSGLDWIGLDGF